MTLNDDLAKYEAERQEIEQTPSHYANLGKRNQEARRASSSPKKGGGCFGLILVVFFVFVAIAAMQTPSSRPSNDSPNQLIEFGDP
ncbi:MAG: hypothetical protein EAZ52_06700 [Alphaproteobacteria bacterium]|nr:MAG: hypothetical protein EAZ52_06700 [Alphaproteobacteria bacterium]